MNQEERKLARVSLAGECVGGAKESQKELDKLICSMRFASTPRYNVVLLDAGIFALYDSRNIWLEKWHEMTNEF